MMGSWANILQNKDAKYVENTDKCELREFVPVNILRLLYL